MTSYSERASQRRASNADALKVFGMTNDGLDAVGEYRCVREGNGVTVFTVGYEKRDGEDLVGALIDAGVSVLVDVRERPFSRKPDFRRSALEGLCEESGVQYESWPELGSTHHQRKRLSETGDFSEFRKRFRDLMVRNREEILIRLSKLAKSKTIALMCYERCHEECHRSIVAELLGDEINATVLAIV